MSLHQKNGINGALVNYQYDLFVLYYGTVQPTL